MEQEQVFAIVGQQYLELILLRRQMEILRQQQAEACPRPCCAIPEESPE